MEKPAAKNPEGLTMPAPEFVPLSEELVPSAARLSAKVGWNQTEEDWRRLRRIHPGGVRVWTDGEVRASYSVVEYRGGLAWIGMILSDPGYRGRGLGKQAFTEALDAARSGGCPVVGLDATEMGEGIYRKFGFERVCPIVRWEGILRPSGPGEGSLARGLSPGLLELDRRCANVDRSALLTDLARSAEVFRLERKGDPVAFAAVRPGRTAWHIGPMVAISSEDFAEVFRQIAARLSGRRVVCDVLGDGISGFLQGHGLRPARTLQRMTLPRNAGCLRGEAVWCAAGFEWG